jgi:hypothetical protein
MLHSAKIGQTPSPLIFLTKPTSVYFMGVPYFCWGVSSYLLSILWVSHIFVLYYLGQIKCYFRGDVRVLFRAISQRWVLFSDQQNRLR